jgi:hypothetical protein
VDGVRDELFPCSRFPANERRRHRPRDLGDLLADLPHRAAGAKEIGKVVALAQFLPQVCVLVEQLLALVVDQPLHLHGLRDHRGDDPEKFLRAVVVAIGLELEVDAQGADRFPVQHDRHADEAQLLLRQLRPLRRAVQKHRLAADLGHDDGFAAFHHPARDAFAKLVADPITRAVEPIGRFDLELAGIFVEYDHGAANGAVMPAEDLENAVEARLEIDRAGKRLARIEERGQAADFACRGFGGFGRFGRGASGGHGKSNSNNNVRRIERNHMIVTRYWRQGQVQS